MSVTHITNHGPLFSDPAELLLAMEGASVGTKSRFTGDAGLRPSRADVVEQWARQSSGHAQRQSALASSIQRRGSDSLGKLSFEVPMRGCMIVIVNI